MSNKTVREVLEQDIPGLDKNWDFFDIFTEIDDWEEANFKALIYLIKLIQDQSGPRPGTQPEPEMPQISTKQLMTILGVPVSSANYHEESQGAGEYVTVKSGGKKEVIKWRPDGCGIVWETGVTNNNYSTYRYNFDDEELFDGIRSPLGSWAEPKRFPHPILINNKAMIIVERDKDADTGADYRGLIRGLSISRELYNKLANMWRV